MTYELVPPEHELLRTKLEPFDFANPPIDPIELAKELVATMFEHNGIGLSANQCGLPYRVFAMRAETPFVCFNPRIVDRSTKVSLLEEGCLSFPNLVYKVNRSDSIRTRFTTPNGETTTKVFIGMTSRVYQHEMMHMDGMLPMEGIGRMKMEKALKDSDRRGTSYRSMNLLKIA